MWKRVLRPWVLAAFLLGLLSVEGSLLGSLFPFRRGTAVPAGVARPRLRVHSPHIRAPYLLSRQPSGPRGRGASKGPKPKVNARSRSAVPTPELTAAALERENEARKRENEARERANAPTVLCLRGGGQRAVGGLLAILQFMLEKADDHQKRFDDHDWYNEKAFNSYKFPRYVTANSGGTWTIIPVLLGGRELGQGRVSIFLLLRNPSCYMGEECLWSR